MTETRRAPPVLPPVAQRVKAARLAFDLKGVELAGGEAKRPIVVQIEKGKNKVSGQEARDLLVRGFGVTLDELAAYLSGDGDLVRFARASSLPQAKAWLARAGHPALPSPKKPADVDEARATIVRALRERDQPPPESVIHIIESMAAKPAGPTALVDWERDAWAIWRAHSRPEPRGEVGLEHEEQIDVSSARLDELTKPKRGKKGDT